MRMFMMVVALTILPLIGNAFAADIGRVNAFGVHDYLPKQIGVDPDIIIRGKIVKGDYQKFIEVLGSYDSPPLVTLSSPGGNLLEAMRIGRLIRKLGLKTVAPRSWDQNKHPMDTSSSVCRGDGFTVLASKFIHLPIQKPCGCASACFFIWVSGIEREGKLIQFHRPYFSGSDIPDVSLEDFTKTYKNVEVLIDNYLTEMGLPRNWIDKVISTPSSESYRISPDEAYALRQFLPVSTEEWLLSQCFALTSREIRDRDTLLRLRETQRGLSGPEDSRLQGYFSKYNEFTLCKRQRLGRYRTEEWDNFLENYPLQTKSLISRTKEVSELLKNIDRSSQPIDLLIRSINLAVEWSMLRGRMSKSDSPQNFQNNSNKLIEYYQTIKTNSYRVRADNFLDSVINNFEDQNRELRGIYIYNKESKKNEEIVFYHGPLIPWRLYPSLEYSRELPASIDLIEFIEQSEKSKERPSSYLSKASIIANDLEKINKLNPTGRLVSYISRLENGEILTKFDDLDFDKMINSYEYVGIEKDEEKMESHIELVSTFYGVLGTVCLGVEKEPKKILGSCSRLFSEIRARHKNAKILPLFDAYQKFSDGDEQGAQVVFLKFKNSYGKKSVVRQSFGR